MGWSFFLFGLSCFMVGFYSNSILNHKKFNAYVEAFHKLQVWACGYKKISAKEVGTEAGSIYLHFLNGRTEDELFNRWAYELALKEKLESLKNPTEKI